MIADVCDWDEWKNGLRREGAFGAAYGWFTKLGSSAAILVSGSVLVLTGFNADLGAGQAPETIVGMRILVAIIPAATFVGAYLLLRNYVIDAKLIEQIQMGKR